MPQLSQLIRVVALMIVLTSIGTAQTPIEISGVDSSIAENIRLHLKTLPNPDPKTSLEEIKKAIAPYGYFEPTIHLEKSKVNIELGRPIRIVSMNIEIEGPGKTEPTLVHYLQNLPLKIGGIVNTIAYQKMKRELYHLAEQRGYRDAATTQSSITIDKKTYTAIITIRFSTGPQYRIGPVHFDTDLLTNELLQRYRPFTLGDPLTSKQLIQLQDNLANSGYFESIQIEPKISKTHAHSIPIDVHLKLKKPHQLTYGIGYGTDTSIRGTLGWDWRRINSSGHQLKTLIQVSPIQSTSQISYLIPGFDPVTSQWSLSTAGYRIHYPTIYSLASQTTLSYAIHKESWQRTIALNALYEDYEGTLEPNRNAFIVFPSLHWQIKKSDELLNPKNGYSVTLNFSGGSQKIIGDVDVIKSDVAFKWLYSLTDDARISLQGNVGILSTPDIFQLPPTLRFYAGGMQNLRGYSYQSVGPGKDLIIGSLDVQHRVYDKWWLGGFYDIGNVGDSFVHDLKRDYGMLIERETPIGPIRVGIARAIDHNDNQWRFIFSMGPNL